MSISMENPTDWLSRLLSFVPVSGRLDHRCFLGAPWRIDYGPSAPGQMPYHIVLGGSVVLDSGMGGPPQRLEAGDIILITDGAAHALHDGGSATPRPNHDRTTLNITVTENDGSGERLDMLCGTFLVAPAHVRMLRSYLPSRIVISASENSAAVARSVTGAQVAGLVRLMRVESANEHVGGLAMLNALSTAMFALTLRLASDGDGPADGLLALAGNPKLAPALTAMFNDPARAWTLPELAGRCNMSRATFIRHFQQRLDRSPIDLLTDIRMTVAANALRATDQSTGAVAELAGYQSEAAFQRAFKQHLGVTPAQWRKQERMGRAAPKN